MENENVYLKRILLTLLHHIYPEVAFEEDGEVYWIVSLSRFTLGTFNE